MAIQIEIEQLIQGDFQPAYMQLVNESHQHAGPSTESHYKLVLVAQAFAGMSRVKRHQGVYKVLKDIMPRIHALALHTYSLEEWQASQTVPASPLCAGGSKA